MMCLALVFAMSLALYGVMPAQAYTEKPLKAQADAPPAMADQGALASPLILVYGADMLELETGALARLAGLLDDARSRGEVIFLFGGDSLGPSMLSSLDKGGHIIDVLNLMEPDAMAVSKREFLFREDELSLRASEAFFPLLCSNFFDPMTNGNLPGLESELMIQRAGRTIGVFAMVGEQLIDAYPLERGSLRASQQVVEERATSLRRQGADTVVLLTDFQPPQAEAWLSEGLVDVLIGQQEGKSVIMPSSRGVYVMMASETADALEIDLTALHAQAEPHAEPQAKKQDAARLVLLENMPESPLVRERMAYYLTRMEALLQVELGTVTAPFSTERARVRTAENEFGNFVADAVRAAFGVDVALINGGVIRGNRSYSAGQMLTRRDIRMELPFHDEVALISVSGKDLWAALENGLSRIEDGNGRFPHVAGIRVVYDPEKAPGKRLVSVHVGEKHLADKATYTMATTNFIAHGGDGYTMLAGRRVVLSSVLLADIIRQRLEAQDSLSLALDQRMVTVQSMRKEGRQR